MSDRQNYAIPLNTRHSLPERLRVESIITVLFTLLFTLP